MTVATSPRKATQYRREAARSAERSRARSQSGRDIGAIPPIADLRARAEVRKSLRRFCELCLPRRFFLGWSSNHLKAIELLEQCVLSNALLAYAMPRGSGKTTLVEAAALWATLEGYRRFVPVIGSTQKLANDIIESWKVELSMNDELAALYPAACYPFRALEGEPRRAAGQLFHGQKTYIKWGEDEIGLAQIPGEPASGARLVSLPLTGSIRGLKRTMPDGTVVRPDLVICDDPQTKESAQSPTQTQTRIELIKADVMGMAGPAGMSVVVPCTVVCRDDLSDQLLDRKKHPEWRGYRTKLVDKWPDNEDLWDRYARIREESFEQHGDIRLATAFYRENRAAMDKGAVVTWEDRREEGHLSALQSAFEKRLKDPKGFEAEMQNEPKDEGAGEAVRLRSSAIAERCNGVERCMVPDGLTTVTAMIDVQDRALYYLVAAWTEGFTGAIIDYGAWPEQRQEYFTYAKITRTLGRRYPGTGLEGAWSEGLKDLIATLAERSWMTVSGEALRLQKMLIDANYHQSTDTVYSVCASSVHGALLVPSHGKGITASGAPMDQYKRYPGEKHGLNWYQPRPKKRSIKAVSYDTNWWKSFLAARLTTTPGDVGAVTLFGDRPAVHRMFADHMVSEVPTRTSGRGREVDDWKHRPNKPDNHLLDCAVGAAVAGSMAGITIQGQESASPRRARRKLSDIQRAKRR